MPSGPEHVVANSELVGDETTITNLRVTGKLPVALTGQYVCIGRDRTAAQRQFADFGSGKGTVHALAIDAGRATSYRTRAVKTDTAARQPGVEPTSGLPTVGHEVVASNLVAFGASILAFSDGELAYELDAGLDTIGRVDLAGARRSLVATPKVDPHTGELHLLTFASLPSQLHVAVSRGALRRTIRSIGDAPSRIRELELTRDDVVLMAQGFVGVAARAGAEIKPIWSAIDTEARHIVRAHRQAETVVVYAIGQSLVRWTFDRRASTVQSDVLDATPHMFATSHSVRPGPHRFLWTVGAGAAHKHDLFGGLHRRHDFGDGRTPGELTFIADVERSDREDGGWLVGFVHDDAGDRAEFVVLDAEAIERSPVATVDIPRQVPCGARGTWIPAHQSTARCARLAHPALGATHQQ